MAMLSMCRICFVKDVRMHFIVNTYLQETYENLTAAPFNTKKGRPLQVCYICYSRLRNCHLLHANCLESEKRLTQMLKNKSIKRTPLQHLPTLKIQHPVISLTVPETLEVSDNAKRIREVKCEVQVKIENSEDTEDNIDQAASSQFIEPEITIKSECSSEDDAMIDNDHYTTGADNLTATEPEITVKSEDFSMHDDMIDDDHHITEEADNLKVEITNGDEVKSENISQNIPIHQLVFVNVGMSSKSDFGPPLLLRKSLSDELRQKVTPIQVDALSSRMALDCSGEISKRPKTNAEICKEYRKRKKEANKSKKVPKIPLKKINNTENCRMYRLKRKMRAQGEQLSTNQVPYTTATPNSAMALGSSPLLITTDLTTERHGPAVEGSLAGALTEKRGTATKYKANEDIVYTTHTKDKNCMNKLDVSAGEKPYKCKVCDKSFSHKCTLRTHGRVHTEEKPYKCNLCDKWFNYAQGLRIHILKHTGDKPFKCHICDKSFYRKSHLVSHIPIHNSEKPYKCDVCQKCFKLKAQLRKHIFIHTGAKSYKCNMCEKSFNYKHNLYNHKRNHTGEKYKCELCDKCFTYAQGLKSHVLKHSGEKPFKCHICSKSFYLQALLSKHVRIHTSEKPYKCDVCQKCFKSKDHLRKHIFTHTGAKTYKCNMCEKSFNYKHNLYNHKRNHTGEKYKCELCDKCFTYAQGLKSHVRKHSDEKPFKCQICSKSFYLKALLEKHVRVHTNEKPYKCDVCEVCFKQKYQLKMHLNKHTGE